MEIKTATFKLAPWKKTPSFEARMENIDEVKRSFSAILLQTTNNEVKTLLNKLSTSVTYGENKRILDTADVNTLKECFMFVSLEPQRYLETADGLTKEGLIYNITKGLFGMLPHYCSNCEARVPQNSEDGEYHCIGCDTFSLEQQITFKTFSLFFR